MFSNVNRDKLEVKSRDLFTPVVSRFHRNTLIINYDKLFAAPYKTKKRLFVTDGLSVHLFIVGQEGCQSAIGKRVF